MPRAHARARCDRARQARGHREQGAARAARQRDLRRGARQGRDGRLRGVGGRRHPDHQGACARASRPTASSGSPASSTARRTSSCPRCARAGASFADVLAEAQALRLRRSRSDVRRRRHRCRAQAHDHVRHRLRRADAVRQGVRRGHHQAHAARTSATPRSSAIASSSSASRAARRTTGIELRVHPTLVPATAPDRQRRGRDERRAGQGRRRRRDALLRRRRRRRADGERRDRRPRRRHAHAHRGSGASRSASRLPARPARRASRSCRWATSQTSYYLRMRVDDKPGVLADITRILADREISIDAMIQKEPSEGEKQTDIILLTHRIGRAQRRRRDRARSRRCRRCAAQHRAHPPREPAVRPCR